MLDSGTQYSPSNLPGTITSEFVFYSACYSAKTNTSLNLNLCSQTVSNGATAVIGYTDSVGVNASRCLELNFYDLAISDVSAAYIPVYWALSQAKTVAASVYGTSDSAVTSSVMYGNGGFHF